MAGVSGGWETRMRKELLRRKQRAERKERLKTLFLIVLFFPFWLFFCFINYASSLHKHS